VHLNVVDKVKPIGVWIFPPNGRARGQSVY